MWNNWLWSLHQDYTPARSTCYLVTRGYSSARTSAILTWFILRLIPFSKDQVCLNRKPIWVDGRGEAKINRAPKWSYKRRFPAWLWPIEKMNRIMCGEGKAVEGRHWSGAFGCRIIFKIKLFFISNFVI